MKSLHRIEVTGVVATEPELRYTKNGTPVLSFRVPVNDVRRDESDPSGWRTDTTWYSVVIMGKNAEYHHDKLMKRDLLYIAGRPQARTYQTREGETRLALEIIFPEITVLHKGRTTEG